MQNTQQETRPFVQETCPFRFDRGRIKKHPAAVSYRRQRRREAAAPSLSSAAVCACAYRKSSAFLRRGIDHSAHRCHARNLHPTNKAAETSSLRRELSLAAQCSDLMKSRSVEEGCVRLVRTGGGGQRAPARPAAPSPPASTPQLPASCRGSPASRAAAAARPGRRSCRSRCRGRAAGRRCRISARRTPT